MTLVFRSAAGALLQTQVGAADVVAAVSLARSVCGWVGGLSNVRNLLASVPGIFPEERAQKLAKQVPLGPAVAYVFTQNGAVQVADEDGGGAFGGDLRTQLIGLSICALAHECGDATAVDLFVKYLAPTLFQAGEAFEALHSELRDSPSRILNEGAARGLTDIFNTAISELNLPTVVGYRGVHENTEEGVHTDINYVVGFLLWLTQKQKDTYLTRSSVVARVAVCLKAVGYFVGQIQSWSGSGTVPRLYGSNSVILVTGGHSETDPLLSGYSGEQLEITHHYRFSSVGSLLSNALRNQSNVRPEVFQDYFEGVDAHVKGHLSFRWTIETASDFGRYYGPRGSSRVHNHGERFLSVKAEWAPDRRRPNPVAIRLASVYFSSIAEDLAPCYERISSPEVLHVVTEKRDMYLDAEVPEEIVKFRVITASIVLAIVGQLAPEDFKKAQHCTSLGLVDSSWLATTSMMIDASKRSGLQLGDVVFLLAAIHAGCSQDVKNDQKYESMRDSLVGWRNGTYAVIPLVITNMAPTAEAIGFRCFNGFWANAVVQKTGAVISGPDRTLYVDHAFASSTLAPSTLANSVQSLSGPYIGPPARGPPDKPLYLSIERSSLSDDAELCFCGRINGMSVGAVGIKEVITTLVASYGQQTQCPGHSEPMATVNIKASDWAKEDLLKPVGQWGKSHTFVPVEQDPCWALFLAGQASYFDGRLMNGCVDCAAEELIEGSVIVGY